MSEKLSEAYCEPCRTGAPMVSDEEAEVLIKEINQWHINMIDGVKQLQRQFEFKNFAAALVFTNSVGELAEREGHHPAITTEWGKVKVSWWTHKINGLHRNDFIMASKTDQIFET